MTGVRVPALCLACGAGRDVARGCARRRLRCVGLCAVATTHWKMTESGSPDWFERQNEWSAKAHELIVELEATGVDVRWSDPDEMGGDLVELHQFREPSAFLVVLEVMSGAETGSTVPWGAVTRYVADQERLDLVARAMGVEWVDDWRAIPV